MSKTFDEIAERLSDLGKVIAYLESTPEDSWAVNVVRTKDGKNCLLGHVIDYVYGKGYEGNVMPAWDLFGEFWATEFMYYGVNDGTNPKYPQTTPKQRILAYLRNMQAGIEPTTYQSMELDARRYAEAL
jgi:hypothetical protein